jgi:predicted transcriptional regulator
MPILPIPTVRMYMDTETHAMSADDDILVAVPRGRVRDFMATTFTAVPPTMVVYYVAGMFLTDPANRRFMVMEGQRLVGVVTRKDILRAVQSGLKDT